MRPIICAALLSIVAASCHRAQEAEPREITPAEQRMIAVLLQRNSESRPLAILGLRKATHPELRQFASLLVDQKEHESTLLWGTGVKSSRDLVLAQRFESELRHMKVMQPDRWWDLMWIEIVLYHHRTEISLLRTTRFTNRDLRDFVTHAIALRRKQIRDLKKWKTEWSAP